MVEQLRNADHAQRSREAADHRLHRAGAVVVDGHAHAAESDDGDDPDHAGNAPQPREALYMAHQVIPFRQVADIYERDCAHTRLQAPRQPHVPGGNIADRKAGHHPDRRIRQFGEGMQQQMRPEQSQQEPDRTDAQLHRPQCTVGDVTATIQHRLAPAA